MRSFCVGLLALFFGLLSMSAVVWARESGPLARGVKVLAALNAEAYDWSPNGDRLAYVAADGIWVVETPGFNTPRRLVRRNGCAGGSCPGAELRWSPDGKKLAFSDSRAGDGNDTIWVVNADGSHVQDLLPVGAPFVYVGKRAIRINTWLGNDAIAFKQRCGTGCVALYGVKIQNTKPYRTLGLTQLNMTNPTHVFAWSPTGERAVVATHDGGLGVVTREAEKTASGGLPEDTRPVVRGCVIPENGAIKGSIYNFDQWSPDGKRVLYTGWPCQVDVLTDVAPNLHLWRIDRNKQQQLLQNAGWATWSPDGTKIAFLLFGKPRYDEAHRIIATDFVAGKPVRMYLGVMNARTGVVVSLTSLGEKPVELSPLAGNMDRLRPRWSPDNQQIVTNDVEGNIALISAREGGTRQLILSGMGLPDTMQWFLEVPWAATWSADGKYLALWKREVLFDDRTPGVSRFLPPVGKDEATLSDEDIIRRHFLRMLKTGGPTLGGPILFEYLQFISTYVDQLEEQGKKAENQVYLCRAVSDLMRLRKQSTGWDVAFSENALPEVALACRHRKEKKEKVIYPAKWLGVRGLTAMRPGNFEAESQSERPPSLYIVEAPSSIDREKPYTPQSGN